MFKINQNMLQAIECFNKIDIETANLIQERIFENPGKLSNDIFSEKEFNKLQQKLDWFTKENLSNITSAFSYILMHAVAERNFNEINETLKNHNLSEQHSQLFQENWKKYGPQYSNQVREKPIAMTTYLKDFDWSIQVPMDNSKLPVKNSAIIKGNEQKIEDNDDLFSIDARNPNIIINYQLKQHSKNPESQEENFQVRMTKQQVQNMFENFEVLQEQIDRLQK